MKHHLLYLSILLLCASCKEEKPASDTTVISVDQSDSKSIELSEIFSEIEYVPLKSAVAYGSIFNSWLTVVTKNNRIYLFADADVYESVYSFTMAGAATGHIVFAGEGPGKIVNGSGFFVNDDGTIEILDSYQKKIIKYDIEMGKHISEMAFDDDFSKFIKTGDNYLFYRNNQAVAGASISYNLVLTNSNLNKLSSYMEIPEYLTNYRIKDYNFSNELNGVVLFKNFLSNRIYEVQDGQVSEKYVIDFGNSWVSTDILGKLSGDNSREVRRNLLYGKKDHVYHIVNLLHSKDRILFTYFYKDKLHWAFYNKNTGETAIYDQRINNIDYSLLGQKLYWPRSIHDDKVVFVVSSEELRYDLQTILKRYSESELELMRKSSTFSTYEKFVNSIDESIDGVMILAGFVR